MTRSELLGKLSRLHAASVRYDEAEQYQKNLASTYRRTAVRRPFIKHLWLWIFWSSFALLFSIFVGLSSIVLTALFIAIVWRTVLILQDYLAGRPGSTRYQAVVSHNVQVKAKIEQSKKRQKLDFSQEYHGLGGQEFYPLKYTGQHQIAEVYQYIHDLRANSVGEAVNLLANADSLRRQEARANQRHNAALDQQRAAQASAAANAMMTRWAIDRQGR